MSEYKKRHYTDTLPYALHLTAKYYRALAIQIINEKENELTFDEIIALDTISENASICQRDLAKLILKDRANTGRLVENLEKKGFIERYNDTKNNRLVKKLKIADKGENKLIEVSKKFDKAQLIFTDIISDEEADKIMKKLTEIRNNINKILNMQI